MVLVAALVAAFASSPWPGALLIRKLFDSGATQGSARLQPLGTPLHTLFFPRTTVRRCRMSTSSTWTVPKVGVP